MEATDQALRTRRPCFRTRAGTLAAAAAVVVAIAACGDTSSTAAPQPTEPASTPIPSVTAIPTVTAGPAPEPSSPVVGSVDWSDPNAVADLGDGWTIAACDGGAPLLCVGHDGATVGTIEALRFPIASFDVYDPGADDLDNLRRIAADFTGALAADRSAGCPPGYVVEPLGPVAVTVAGRQGLHYGYVGTNVDGSPSERNLQYATIDGDDLVLLAAIAYDAGGCPGRDDLSGFDSAALALAEPRIDAVLAGVPLPSGVGL